MDGEREQEQIREEPRSCVLTRPGVVAVVTGVFTHIHPFTPPRGIRACLRRARPGAKSPHSRSQPAGTRSHSLSRPEASAAGLPRPQRT